MTATIHTTTAVLQSEGSTAGRAFLYALTAAFLVSLALSLVVGVRVLRGYRDSGQRTLLLFGLGVLCIVFLSKVTRVVLMAGFGVGLGVTGTVTAGWRVLGALLVVRAIYDRGGAGP